MEITFWGVRGTAATPDGDKLRYGGNTTSMTVISAAMPDLFWVLDAGTGMARFGGSLGMRDHYHAVLLVSHLHLYHIIGFQFTPFAYSPHSETLVIGPSTRNIALESVFDHIMSPSYSPVYGLENLMAKVQFQEVSTAMQQIDKMSLLALPFEHSQDTESWGYRLQDESGVLVYLTDATYRLPNGKIDPNALQLAQGADVLIAGAFDPAHAHPHYPSYADVFDLAREADVKQVYITHHHMLASDDHLDRAAEDAQRDNPDVAITLAAEGMTVRF